MLLPTSSPGSHPHVATRPTDKHLLSRCLLVERLEPLAIEAVVEEGKEECRLRAMWCIHIKQGAWKQHHEATGVTPHSHMQQTHTHRTRCLCL